jgi:NTP pyrophosphatase (non-canonical NTP hydrolase)
MDFTVLRDANVRRQQEWDRQGKIDIAYRGNELAGECGEACNIIKKIERERRGIRGSRATLRQLADELADVIICVDLIALYEGIDIWESVKRKFNETSRNNNLDTTL